jgi:hypothetical protein
MTNQRNSRQTYHVNAVESPVSGASATLGGRGMALWPVAAGGERSHSAHTADALRLLHLAALACPLAENARLVKSQDVLEAE